MLDTSEHLFLGRGTFGDVFEVKWQVNRVAAKRLFNARSDGGFDKEFTLLTQLHHPNIVQVFGFYISDDGQVSPPVMVMELLHKPLSKRICQQPQLNLVEIIDRSLEIVSALCHLHGMRSPGPIIHRDISSNNVMLTRTGNCKLVDLGVAKVCGGTDANQTPRPGKEVYMPIEAWIPDYDECLDVFSFGLVILEMILARPLALPQPCFKQQGSVEDNSKFTRVRH